MLIYHGSEKVIENPIYGFGKRNNDYGLGFYCTESIELAKEWAVKTADQNGYCNIYDLDTKDLRILYLNDEKYNILNWITILLENRTFLLKNNISVRAKEYLIKNFSIDYRSYDVIVGYRADDAYFQYAQSFLDNTISISTLEKSMKLGNLGLQVVLISGKAFGKITFLDFENVFANEYFQRRELRRITADNEFKKAQKEIVNYEKEVFLIDLMRNGVTNDEFSLR